MKYNKKIKHIPLMILFVVLVILLTACSSTEQQFQFPLNKEDIEKVIADKELNWLIKDVDHVENSVTIFTLENNENVTVDLIPFTNENGKVITLNWVLPKDISSSKINEFYRNELPNIFEVVSTFYGNSKELEKGFRKFSEYYLESEDNLEGSYWTKRIGDDHLLIEIKTNLNSKDIVNIGTLTITSTSSYEKKLKTKSQNLKYLAKVNSIEISDSTVLGMLEFVQPEDATAYYSKHFSLYGQLEDINEIKTVPESLRNLKSEFLKPNRDKYLLAKLVDDTGSVDVFLQNTSLNKEELSMNRIHNVVLLYYDNNPILIVRNSALIE